MTTADPRYRNMLAVLGHRIAVSHLAAAEAQPLPLLVGVTDPSHFSSPNGQLKAGLPQTIDGANAE